MLRIDLHTHSVASPDGGITAEQYRKMLQEGSLDYVAITDHNTIDFALKMQQELGERIIVGEEIMTQEGEIIGLYLRETIPSALSLKDAVERIKLQGGLVYVPHPFETVRSGVSEPALLNVIDSVDIIEMDNGRAVFQNKSGMAKAWAKRFRKAGAAASDAHGMSGWGRTFTAVTSAPARDNLVELLRKGETTKQSPGLIGLLYPKLNRVKKAVKHD